MKLLTIKRISSNNNGTFGVLIKDSTPFCLSIERPWLDNLRGLSCIPSGLYICDKTTSGKFGETFRVLAVPERSEILFHKGNTTDDTSGCILLGESFSYLNGRPAIKSSAQAFDEFINIFKNDQTFQLNILWC